ncbi:MAG: RluA family pseudouridine synthase [Candidatus Jorgensenbacteria bacterium]|nr:RluA family pseudouridine synthase [Candidatus Jorgensenbacteria bacterium]
MEFIAEKNGRLDVILIGALPKEYSRHRIKRGIEEGAVLVNGAAAVKASMKLNVGDRITVDMDKFPPPVEELRAAPDPSVPLDIVYEDDDCLVVNKPPGLLTHPTPTRLTGTLAGALLARYPALADIGESPLRPGIVHRLDEGTSGLLVVAKTNEAFQFLKRQFIGRSVRKVYYALVEGNPEKKEGVIEYAIRPSSTNPAKRVAVKYPLPRGTGPEKRTSLREAETRYRVVESFGNRFALLELHPKTGRTHQLRVHLAAIGHPVVGDTLYGSKTPAPRQLLHAAHLEFERPSHRPISLDAPLPEDFASFLKQIKN